MRSLAESADAVVPRPLPPAVFPPDSALLVEAVPPSVTGGVAIDRGCP